MSDQTINELAFKIALKLRLEECIHGLPYQVTAKEDIYPYGKDATCRPLCDACVMKFIREILSNV